MRNSRRFFFVDDFGSARPPLGWGGVRRDEKSWGLATTPHSSSSSSLSSDELPEMSVAGGAVGKGKRGKLEREAARGSEKLSEKKRCLALLHVSPVQSLLFPLLLREGQAASKYLSQIQASAPPPCPVEYAFPCVIFFSFFKQT